MRLYPSLRTVLLSVTALGGLSSCGLPTEDPAATTATETTRPSALAFGAPAPTAQYPVTDGDAWIKNYLQYREDHPGNAQAPQQVGWLVNAAEMSRILNAARTGGYVHISLALRDPARPQDVTLVISGVDAGYTHQYIGGTQVLQSVHPCPVCVDADRPATGYRVRNYFYCTSGGQTTPCPGPVAAGSTDEYGF